MNVKDPARQNCGKCDIPQHVRSDDKSVICLNFEDNEFEKKN